MDGDQQLTVETVAAIDAVDAAAWDACAGGVNPFVGHTFLAALETSRSVGGRSGWQPMHVVARVGERVVGVVPMYAKAHSYGEYVFDHGWAQAYERAGGRYYPKLQVAVPFTPVPGPRLLVRPDAPDGTREALVAALAEIARRRRVSSLHVTFCTEEDKAAFAEAGWLIRQGFQFHWDNAGYQSFDAFLDRLSHGRRKAIRRERRAVAEQGIALEVVSGADLTRRHWDTFFDFYIATSERKWGDPYLTREFFDVLGSTMGERVALVLASREGKWIGGALNLIGADALYGRNWGCRGDYPFLHFEACYYQAIDFAIARGLARVEAGAQGEHKLGRGYLPRATWSAHFIPDANFRAAVEDFLRRETHAIRHEMTALMADSPFKQAAP
jgi:predicted N-acyltransferase